jgi:hypothetical protein
VHPELWESGLGGRGKETEYWYEKENYTLVWMCWYLFLVNRMLDMYIYIKCSFYYCIDIVVLFFFHFLFWKEVKIFTCWNKKKTWRFLCLFYAEVGKASHPGQVAEETMSSYTD